METHTLVYPLFAMVLLSLVTLLRLFTGRMAAVRAGSGDFRYYKTYQDGGEAVELVQLSRNFSNLFEAPTLFYAACLAAMVTGQASHAVLGFAWAYVLARCIHSVIHTGSNALYPRIGAYFGSWVMLLGLWIAVVVGAAP